MKDIEKEVTDNLQLYHHSYVSVLACAEEFEINNEKDISTICNDKLWRIFEMVQDKLCKKKDFIMHQCDVQFLVSIVLLI